MSDKVGAEYALRLSSADVFVFPSRTDTVALVMLEAMACGTPLAAFPVTGPIDVVRHGVTGVLDEALARAARKALDLSRDACREPPRGADLGACLHSSLPISSVRQSTSAT